MVMCFGVGPSVFCLVKRKEKGIKSEKMKKVKSLGLMRRALQLHKKNNGLLDERI